MRIRPYWNLLLDVYQNLTITLLYGKDKITFDVVRSTSLSSKERKKDQSDHKDISLEAPTIND